MIDSIQSVRSFSTSALTETATENTVAGSTLQSALAPSAPQPMSFAQVLGDMATDAVNALKLSETKSFEAVQGKASTREVVDAVMSAEQALQTAISIRDKVVTAYLDVARMQI
ncbi:flagellar hook-basal body complex protein FliE [Mycoplana ramosa]|uniref:Flagellar hook-basal body complex protein FliE n=1 Tax=Mycoplana ramosa TaxID=40837 RepID=A0ABW3YWU7_MYCRA